MRVQLVGCDLDFLSTSTAKLEEFRRDGFSLVAHALDQGVLDLLDYFVNTGRPYKLLRLNARNRMLSLLSAKLCTKSA